MKELKKLSLKEEIDKQAEKIEKEVCENKEIEDMKVSEDMETSLFSRIQEYEYDKRIKKVHRRKKKAHDYSCACSCSCPCYGKYDNRSWQQTVLESVVG